MSSAQPAKRRGPKPTGKTPGVTVRLDPDITAALDGIVAGSDEFVTRSDVIRTILRAWLVANQMLPGKDA